jgi:HlyD family secretion protein
MPQLRELFKQRSQWIKGAAVVLVLLLTVILLVRPKPVQVVYPTQQNLTAEAFGNGTVEARVVVPVSAKVTGLLLSLHADQGDLVKKGQVLARLDQRETTQQEQQGIAQRERSTANFALEQAQLHKAEVARDQAVANARRYQALVEKDLVATMEAEQYLTSAKTAEAEVARARAALVAARQDQQVQTAALGATRSRLADLVIVAPQNGIIISRNQEAGAVVVPGMPVFRLADPATIWIHATLDETLLRGLVVGQPATISVRSAPGTVFKGHLARIGRESDRVTEESRVEVAFDTPRNVVRIGEQAEVRIQTAQRSATVAIPAASLVFHNRESGVWIVQDGRLRYRAVQTGIKDPKGLVEVISGLKHGDAVVMASAQKTAKFSDGQRVRIQR